ncbi:unnamed protein product, partial [Pylaiella littoralis]
QVLKPGLVKGHWSADEDDNLRKRREKYPSSNWGFIAKEMFGRTSKQCRERWLHHLDPRITKKKFTAGEDEYILEAQAELRNKWSVIATRLPGRTENDIKVRWHA